LNSGSDFPGLVDFDYVATIDDPPGHFDADGSPADVREEPAMPDPCRAAAVTAYLAVEPRHVRTPQCSEGSSTTPPST
jgi:hypothetical protein